MEFSEYAAHVLSSATGKEITNHKFLVKNSFNIDNGEDENIVVFICDQYPDGIRISIKMSLFEDVGFNPENFILKTLVEYIKNEPS